MLANVNCPSCKTLHTGLNFGGTYKCHVCGGSFKIDDKPFDQTLNQQLAPTGFNATTGALYLILTGVGFLLSMYVLFIM